MSERGRWMRDVREMGERCEGDEWEMWGTCGWEMWKSDVCRCSRVNVACYAVLMRANEPETDSVCPQLHCSTMFVKISWISFTSLTNLSLISHSSPSHLSPISLTSLTHLPHISHSSPSHLSHTLSHLSPMSLTSLTHLPHISHPSPSHLSSISLSHSSPCRFWTLSASFTV